MNSPELWRDGWIEESLLRDKNKCVHEIEQLRDLLIKLQGNRYLRVSDKPTQPASISSTHGALGCLHDHFDPIRRCARIKERKSLVAISYLIGIEHEVAGRKKNKRDVLLAVIERL